jgi:hypothetical protein
MIEALPGCDRSRLNLLFESRRLERLARDMRLVAAGLAPTEVELEAAPIIDGWRFGCRTLTSLEGTSIGHPRLPDGPVHTTDLWVIDSKRRWARTLSRYYVLGAPHAVGAHGQ